MIRQLGSLLFAPLLLATGVALAQEAPSAGQSATAGQATTRKDDKDAKQKDEQQKAQEAKEQEEKEKAKKEEEAKLLSGMSVLGNQEAPKALVIVPWKSSELGNALGISPLLDDSRLPVDRDVFMRALGYYEIRSGTTRLDGAPTGGVGAAAATSDAAHSATEALRRKK